MISCGNIVQLTSRISARRLVASSTRPSWAWTLFLTSIFFFSISSSFALKIANADRDISSSLSSFIGLPLQLIIPEFFTRCICDCCCSHICFGVAIAASLHKALLFYFVVLCFFSFSLQWWFSFSYLRWLWAWLALKVWNQLAYFTTNITISYDDQYTGCS